MLLRKTQRTPQYQDVGAYPSSLELKYQHKMAPARVEPGTLIKLEMT